MAKQTKPNLEVSDIIKLQNNFITIGYPKLEVDISQFSLIRKERVLEFLTFCYTNNLWQPPSPNNYLSDKDENRTIKLPLDKLTVLGPHILWNFIQSCHLNPACPEEKLFIIFNMLQKVAKNTNLGLEVLTPICFGIQSGYIDEVSHIMNFLDESPLNDIAVITNQKSCESEFSSGFFSVEKQLLESYECPITREILVEPVTLQCGHSFSRMALESMLVTGSAKCPICKSAIPSRSLGINVVMRDTIETIFPHILRSRAVDDIMLAKKLGVRELRSVMRWLENFSHASEVLDAAASVLLDWLLLLGAEAVESGSGRRDSPHEGGHFADKFVNEGHLKIVCKCFQSCRETSTSFSCFVRMFMVLSESRQGQAVQVMLAQQVHSALVRAVVSLSKGWGDVSLEVTETRHRTLKDAVALTLILAGEMEWKCACEFARDKSFGLPTLIKNASFVIDSAVQMLTGNQDCIALPPCVVPESTVFASAVLIAARLPVIICEVFLSSPSLSSPPFPDSPKGSDSSPSFDPPTGGEPHILSELEYCGFTTFVEGLLVHPAALAPILGEVVQAVMSLLARFGRNSRIDCRLQLCRTCLEPCLDLLRTAVDRRRSLLLLRSCHANEKSSQGALDDTATLLPAVAAAVAGLLSVDNHPSNYFTSNRLSQQDVSDVSKAMHDLSYATVFRARPPEMLWSWSQHRYPGNLSSDCLTSVEMNCEAVVAFSFPTKELNCELNTLSLSWTTHLNVPPVNVSLVVLSSSSSAAVKLGLENGIPYESLVSLGSIPFVSIDLQSGRIIQRSSPVSVATGFEGPASLIGDRAPISLKTGTIGSVLVVVNNASGTVSFSLNGFTTNPFYFQELHSEDRDQAFEDEDLLFEEKHPFEREINYRLQARYPDSGKERSWTSSVSRGSSKFLTFLLVSHNNSEADSVDTAASSRLFTICCPSSSPPARIFSANEKKRSCCRRNSLVNLGPGSAPLLESFIRDRSVNEKSNERMELLVLGQGVSEGLHIFSFVVNSFEGPLSVGVCTWGGRDAKAFIPNDYPLLAVKYESNKQIAVKTQAGYHPCLPIFVAPHLETKDTITIELSLEQKGVVRIFHNETLVGVYESILKWVLQGVLFFPFVSVSNPSDCVTFENVSPLSNRICELSWVCRFYSNASSYLVESRPLVAGDNLQIFEKHVHVRNKIDKLYSLFGFGSWEAFVSLSAILADTNQMDFTSVELLIAEIKSTTKQLRHSLCIKELRIQSLTTTYDIYSAVKILMSMLSDNPFTDKLYDIVGTLCSMRIIGKCASKAVFAIGGLSVYLVAVNNPVCPALIIENIIRVMRAIIVNVDKCALSVECAHSPLVPVLIRKVRLDPVWGGEATKNSLIELCRDLIHGVGLSRLPSATKGSFLKMCLEAGWLFIYNFQDKMMSASAEPQLLVDSIISFFCEDSESLSKSRLRCSSFDQLVASSQQIWTTSRWNSAKSFEMMVDELDSPEVEKSMLLCTDGEIYVLNSPTSNEFPVHLQDRLRWIHVSISDHESWGKVSVVCKRSSETPRTPEPLELLIRCGNSPETMTFVKNISLPFGEGRYSVLEKTEIPSGLNVNDIKLEIVRGTQRGLNFKVCGVSVYVQEGHPKRVALYKLFSEYISLNGVAPETWKECLFFAILEGNCDVLCQLIKLLGPSILRKDIFYGNGPWSWGHKYHTGRIGFLLPCNPMQALARMRAMNLSNEAVEQLFNKSIRSESYFEDESVFSGVDRMRDDVAHSSDNFLLSYESSFSGFRSIFESGRLSVGSSFRTPYSQFTTTGWTRNASRDSSFPNPRALEEIRRFELASFEEALVQAEAASARSSGDLSFATALRRTATTDSGSTTARTTSDPRVVHQGQSSPGRVQQLQNVKTIRYRCADESIREFDVSFQACAKYSFFSGQRVLSQAYPAFGLGTVIGVYGHHLWIHFDRDTGATYRKDDWLFGLLALVEGGTIDGNLGVSSRASEIVGANTTDNSDSSSLGLTLMKGNSLQDPLGGSWNECDTKANHTVTTAPGAHQRRRSDCDFQFANTNDPNEKCVDQDHICRLIWESNYSRFLLKRFRELVDYRQSDCYSDSVAARKRRLSEMRRLSVFFLVLLRTNNDLDDFLEVQADDIDLFARLILDDNFQLITELDLASLLIDVVIALLRCRLELIVYARTVFCVKKIIGLLVSFPLSDPAVSSALELVHLLISKEGRGSGSLSSRLLGIFDVLSLNDYVASTESTSRGLDNNTCAQLFSSGLRAAESIRCKSTVHRDGAFPSSPRSETALHSIPGSLGLRDSNILTVLSQNKDISTDFYDSLENGLNFTEETTMRRPTFISGFRLEEEEVSDLLRICVNILTVENYSSSSQILICVDILMSVLARSTAQLFQLHSIQNRLLALYRALKLMKRNFVADLILCCITELLLNLYNCADTIIPELLDGLLEIGIENRDFRLIINLMKHPLADVNTLTMCIAALAGRSDGKGKRAHTKEKIEDWHHHLRIGDRVDVRDKNGVWYESVIAALRSGERNDCEVLVHYMGWASKYDEWLPTTSERIQVLHSETIPWRDELKLDDPIEVLCINQEMSDKKRRWFRGVVNQINKENNLVLVIFDKRGSREKRWLDLYGEDVCFAGTHVPFSASTSLDTLDRLQSHRRNVLTDEGVHRHIISLLAVFKDDAGFASTALDALRYMLSGVDAEFRIRLICRPELALDLFEILTQHYQENNIAKDACWVLSTIVSHIGSVVLQIGDRVETQWRRLGNTSYPGRVDKIREDGTYDILYDDGDSENSVPRNRIMPQSRDEVTVFHVLQFNLPMHKFENLYSVLTLHSREREVVNSVLCLLCHLYKELGGIPPDHLPYILSTQIPHIIVCCLRQSLDSKSSTNPLRFLEVLFFMMRADFSLKVVLSTAGVTQLFVKAMQTFHTCPRVVATSLSCLYASLSRCCSLLEFSPAAASESMGSGPHETDDLRTGNTNQLSILSNDESGETCWLEIKLETIESWEEVCLYRTEDEPVLQCVEIFSYSCEGWEVNDDVVSSRRTHILTLKDIPRRTGWVPLFTSNEIHKAIQLQNSLKDSKTSIVSASGHMTLRLILNYSLPCRHLPLRYSRFGATMCTDSATAVTGNHSQDVRIEIVSSDAVSVAIECAQPFPSDKDVHHSCRMFLQLFACGEDSCLNLVKTCGGSAYLE